MITVGIVTYNSASDLPRCIAGLRAQQDVQMRILAYENASSDGSLDWMRDHAPEVDVLEGRENIGYGNAHNRLIQESALGPGDYYLALNPDAVLAPNYIACLVSEISDKPETGWAIGKLNLVTKDGAFDGRIYSAGHGMYRSGFAFNIGHGLPDEELFDTSREVFGAPGAAALYKAEMIRDLSEDGAFFDPAMFLYAEDSDVDWRARRQGWKCWYAASAVGYHRGSSPQGALKMTAVGNRYLSVLKNAALYDLIFYNLPIIVVHCLGRLVVSPRMGMHLIKLLITNGPNALRRRKRAKTKRQAMNAWFRWSADQPTTQRSALNLWHNLRRWYR